MRYDGIRLLVAFNGITRRRVCNLLEYRLARGLLLESRFARPGQMEMRLARPYLLEMRLARVNLLESRLASIAKRKTSRQSLVKRLSSRPCLAKRNSGRGLPRQTQKRQKPGGRLVKMLDELAHHRSPRTTMTAVRGLHDCMMCRLD